MLTQPASVFIILFTIVNIVACLWLMWWTARSRSSSAPEQASTSAPQGVDTTGHVWDGDLTELNNPLPRWWLGLFIITILFAGVYLVLYPGLGNYAGMRQWSSVSEQEFELALQREQFEARMAALKDAPLHDLSLNPQAMSTAANLFAANCAACHGSDARGAKGFPNLTDQDWLWGGSEETIHETIANGRHGVMPPLGSVLGEMGVNEAASYVFSLSGGQAPDDWIRAGKVRFDTICAACHGADARGNALLGAPNLTDKIWLHGGDFNSIRATITNGRNNEMPAHEIRLGETKVRLLTAYVLSLSQTQPAMVANTETTQSAPTTGGTAHAAPR
jgi:cytochrome c oxidase cbb3-type subunit 3